jgi:predicted  nucleic acid-binding Zn-ribbon protein
MATKADMETRLDGLEASFSDMQDAVRRLANQQFEMNKVVITLKEEIVKVRTEILKAKQELQSMVVKSNASGISRYE